MTARPDNRYPAPTLADRARWLLHAKPSDHMLALSVASASLPLVGKHLEPFGALTAMSVWGFRHLPEFVTSSAKSWFTPDNTELRKAEREQTNSIAQEALRGVVSPADLAIDWPAPDNVAPLWHTCEYR
ncbi:alpha/beta hydrolase, partial [Mycolicibacterium porcinum]